MNLIGVILSLTGPAASLGILEKNALTLVPKQIGAIAKRLIKQPPGEAPKKHGSDALRAVRKFYKA
jgi:hypothetical protein